MTILQTMADQLAAAKREGAEPMSWQINVAAEGMLLADPNVGGRLKPDQSVEDFQFFGLPLCVRDDRQVGPTLTITTMAPDAKMTFSVGSCDGRKPQEKQG